MQEHMTLEQYRIEMGLGPVPVATGTKKALTDDNGFIQKHENAPEGKQRPSKYGAKKTKVDGITFDSKAEADYYCALKLGMMTGDIDGFCRQPEFILQDGDGTTIRYRADFIIWPKDAETVVVDVKGVETPEFILKSKLFRSKYPKIRLETVK